MDKLDQEQLKYISEFVIELCKQTHKKVDEFMKLYNTTNGAFFMCNVLKNYVGNIILQGCSSEEMYNNMTNGFLLDMMDFITESRSRVKRDNVFKKEVH